MKEKCDFFSSITLHVCNLILRNHVILLYFAHINCYYAYSLYLQIILTWLNEEALGSLFIKHFIYSELFACPMLSYIFLNNCNISLVQWFHLFITVCLSTVFNIQ